MFGCTRAANTKHFVKETVLLQRTDLWSGEMMSGQKLLVKCVLRRSPNRRAVMSENRPVKNISKYPGRLAQLMQLTTATWDGDLLCKGERDELVKRSLAERTGGFSVINRNGLQYLDDLGLLIRNEA